MHRILCRNWHFYDGADKIDDALLFISLAVLVGTWVVALGSFLLHIDRAYLHTFVSTETAPQFLHGWFAHLAGNDERRMVIFQYHAALWRAFADEVADWVAEHYHEMVGQPWFTPAMVETIPESMLPTLAQPRTQPRSLPLPRPPPLHLQWKLDATQLEDRVERRKRGPTDRLVHRRPFEPPRPIWSFST